MRYFILLCLIVIPFVAQAQNAADNAPRSVAAAPEVPEISFAQQVDIVVTAKKNPNLLELKMSQKNDLVLLDGIIERGLGKDQAKTLAQALIRLTKITSIDDKPRVKDAPGKGIYDYRVTLTRPDGVIFITAIKPKQADQVDFEDQFESEPLTRAGAGAQ